MTAAYESGGVTIYHGDALAVLRTLPERSAQCCITSPPYWGLRDYGVDGQLGLEDTPDAYVANIVTVFREVRRVLRDDGTLWLNLGDSYASGGGAGIQGETGQRRDRRFTQPSLRPRVGRSGNKGAESSDLTNAPHRQALPGLKPKDLVGIPWRVAFALQADGWYLRSDIIWSKPNPMPESVTDRPTKSHEYLFLLSKSERYHYDAAAIREPLAESSLARLAQDVEAQAGSLRVPGKTNGPMKAVRRSGNKAGKFRGDTGGSDALPGTHLGTSIPWEDDGSGRNKRSVWTVTTRPFKGAHFATFPPALVEPCVLAGSRAGDVVLDRHRDQRRVHQARGEAARAGRARLRSRRMTLPIVLVPITLREANAFVREHHRHHGPSRGCICCVAVGTDHICGVAIIGRPVARRLQDSWTAEVTRCCTDGTPHAASKLYAAAWRACRALGYRKIVTYTLDTEPGTSLVAAGWKCLGEAGGGSWNCRSRPRVDTHPTQLKLRWEAAS